MDKPLLPYELAPLHPSQPLCSTGMVGTGDRWPAEEYDYATTEAQRLTALEALALSLTCAFEFGKKSIVPSDFYGSHNFHQAIIDLNGILKHKPFPTA